ncbi:uncharacterized protein Z519_06875 [Cladophialophora bantiana CBS 173.52]|uniref:AB hydrolase-1 domain-containing protein n=1 Tax=Cladophialophora bantiana (strain ATCC 10958 / CBS 173.52 / CDC B-1940 / NIH 8579) TaxID=1442370 RepID=A0A0D2ET38_CLAB1|nr:uncharacterized protein Z519_06875 [Cladophialophora bantiana CBS 173.52]KIW93026.1 hypothetical protein Z519_06875 [Cladophialophora bantiana CBS 173.52]
MATPKATEGRVPFSHPSLPKPCETWYKVYGDLTSSSTGRPLVILHGGPGMGHNYLLNLHRLSDQYGIPVVFYDQLGCGHSTHLQEKRLDTDFWVPELFVAELDNLLEHLGISEFDLLGQSWTRGSMFAIRGSLGLKRLIISNSPASMKLWGEACNKWRSQLPRDVDSALTRHEENQTYDDPEYKSAVEEFYKRHVCRVYPFPQDLLDTLANVEVDDTVYYTMNGPSECESPSSTWTWSVVEDVHKITVPTLLLNGEWDEARDSCVYPFFQIPKVKWYTIPGASHCSNLEVPEKYMEVVVEFLKNAA